MIMLQIFFSASNYSNSKKGLNLSIINDDSSDWLKWIFKNDLNDLNDFQFLSY